MLCQFCSPSIVTTGPSLYMFCIQTLGQHKVFSVLVLFLSFFFFPAGQPFLPSPVLKCSRAAVDILETISSLFSAFVNNPECEILPRLCLFFPPFHPSLLFRPLTVYTCRENKEKREKPHQKMKRQNYPKVFSQFFFVFFKPLQVIDIIFFLEMSFLKIPLNATAVKHSTFETEPSQTCVRNQRKFILWVIMWPR